MNRGITNINLEKVHSFELGFACHTAYSHDADGQLRGD